MSISELMASFDKLVRHNDKSITFEINNVDVSVVNSLRRLIFTHIPSVGFYFNIKDHFVENDMTFIKNDSPLHNEFLAHRLSLIPLNFSHDEIENWIDDEYKFVLKKDLTSNESIQDVTTEDFDIYKQGTKMPVSFVRRILPSNKITKDYILITKLRPENNQNKAIHVELIPKKGIGIECICWGTISTCTYFNTVDEVEASDVLKKLLQKDGSNTKSIANTFENTDRYRYYKKNKFNEPNSFTMTIESECALSPELIFQQAMDICIKMLHELVLEFSNDLTTVIKIESIGEISNFYLITTQGHTHTIGNLLQSLLVNKFVRDKQELLYIGYSVPHPLENTFILKIKFKNDTSIKEVREFMIKSLNVIIDDLDNLSSTFSEFHKIKN